MTEDQSVKEVIRAFDNQYCPTWRHVHTFFPEVPLIPPQIKAVRATFKNIDRTIEICLDCLQYWEKAISEVEPLND